MTNANLRFLFEELKNKMNKKISIKFCDLYRQVKSIELFGKFMSFLPIHIKTYQ